ncbi:BQ2448_4656 [Microbotryum intermedium]|uniref:BQ2448_4656 protein n=1 Tax=Microbotryum intermedium TaxID=269621 RepID=A0A238FDR3_9BASI|nr:BQ2448_4656 [Microbotryum intermedium]
MSSTSGRTTVRSSTRLRSAQQGTRAPSEPSGRPTARTAASASALSVQATSEDEDWVLAVIDSRGVGREIGVVGIERALGQVVITQFSDSPTFVKLLHYCTTRPPSLILVPSSALSAHIGEGTGKHAQASRVGTPRVSSEIEDEASIVRLLRQLFKGIPVIGVLRKYWDEQAGFEFITQLIIRDEARHATILAAKPKHTDDGFGPWFGRYYALAATSALFKYLEMTYSVVFLPRSLRITYAPVEGTCLIDVETAANLELVANVINKHSQQHLLGMMSSCVTPMGHRLIRTNLLSPLTDTSVIDTRLDAVEEFVNKEERLTSIRKSLQPLRSLDCDKLVGQLTSRKRAGKRGWGKSAMSAPDPAQDAETKIARLLSLRSLLSALPGIRSALRHSESQLLKSIYSILSDPRADQMLDIISATLNDDAVGPQPGGALKVRNARIYAIKAEKKLLLDVARETYKEALNDAFERSEELKKQHGIEMTLQYSSGNFVYTCPQTELEGRAAPAGFINLTSRGNKIEFSTLDLRAQSTKIRETVQEIFLLSDEVLDDVLDELRGSIACLYRCSEAIAMLDMVASFALLSASGEYVRPEWTDTLAIKSGRNPLHEHFRLSDGPFVPNDTYVSEASSFQLITGVNMSGKSTLLRQVALLNVMSQVREPRLSRVIRFAQVGCFVPASYASFRVIHALLSRLSNDDSIEAGLSTFASEMSTMSMIVGALKICGQCLVLIDELGRGTSPEEGVGIAHALAEVIIKSKVRGGQLTYQHGSRKKIDTFLRNQALCLFATHFKASPTVDLAVSLSRYPNVVSLHLEAEIDRSQADYSLTFHHRVADGATNLIHYGKCFPKAIVVAMLICHTGLELAKLAKMPADVLHNATLASVTLAARAEEEQEQAQGTQLARRRRELLQLRTSLKMLSNSKGMNGANLIERLRELQMETIQTLSATFEMSFQAIQQDAHEKS